MSTPAHESIGTRLTAARTAAGLTTAAAAARLRCDETLLVALEAERYADIGAPVFVQGHLRRYADLLGLPAEALLADWAAVHRGAISAPDLTQVPRPNRPVLIVDPGKLARPLTMLAAAVVIALAAWWILQGAGTSVPSSVVVDTPPVAAAELAPSTDPIAAPQTLTPVAPMVQESTTDVSTTDVAAPASSPSSTATTAPATPAPTLAATTSFAPPTAPRLSGVLTLAVSDECWVEIFDASGTRRYFALAAAGERLRISGPAPWRVVVGRADAVTLEVGGRRTTIPAALVRNATAYVSVDAAGRVQSAEEPR